MAPYGRTSRIRTVIAPTNTAIHLYSVRRKVCAPTRICAAISFIASVPSSARLTTMLKYQASPRPASAAITAK